MAYDIVATQLAAEDLDNILQYISIDLNNPTAASSFADSLEKCYQNLSNMPYMYPKCDNMRLRMMKYRKVVINHYVMIYRVNEHSQTIYIMRFFYGGQDYERLL